MWELVVDIQRKTKRERNSEIDKIELYRPFVFYVVILSCLNVAAIKSGGLRFTQTVAFVSVGLLIWGLYEYAVHRWVLHREPGENGIDLPGNRTHLSTTRPALTRTSTSTERNCPCRVYADRVGCDEAAVDYFLYTGMRFLLRVAGFSAHHGMSRARLSVTQKVHLMIITTTQSAHGVTLRCSITFSALTTRRCEPSAPAARGCEPRSAQKTDNKSPI